MKKRSKLVIKLLVVAAVVGALVAIIVGGGAMEKKKAAEKADEVASLELNVPSLATAVGSFAVDKNGAAIPLNKADDSLKRVEFILDLHCKGCQQVETGISETMKQMMQNGEAQFFFTPVSFMNRASNDDYSARAASTLIEVAETDPENFFSYLTALYKNFPPEGPQYPKAGVSYDNLAQTAKSVGVSEDAISKFKDQRFRLWAQKNAEVVEARTEIFPQGISTPTVLLGGKLNQEDRNYVLEDYTKVLFQDSDVDKTFRDSFADVR